MYELASPELIRNIAEALNSTPVKLNLSHFSNDSSGAQVTEKINLPLSSNPNKEGEIDMQYNIRQPFISKQPTHYRKKSKTIKMPVSL